MARGRKMSRSDVDLQLDLLIRKPLLLSDIFYSDITINKNVLSVSLNIMNMDSTEYAAACIHYLVHC